MSYPVFQKDYVKIFADTDSKLVNVTWNGTCSSEEYRASMEHALEYAQAYDLDGWISNTKRGYAVDPSDSEWVSKEFIPKALSQIKRVAIVVADDVFRKLEVESLENRLKATVQHVAYFDSEEEAQKWIAQ